MPEKKFKIVANNRLSPAQVSIEWNGVLHKHCVVSLREGQTINDALQIPSLWAMIQADRAKALRRGDTVSVIAPDGNTIADRAMVTRADHEVFFSKPQRLVELEMPPLFETVAYRVVPEGARFAVQDKKTGAIDRSRLFESAESAKADLLARQPVAV